MDYSLAEEKKILIKQLEQSGELFDTGFIVTDPAEGKDSIVFVNQSFTNITGYSQEEVQGENLQFLHGKYTNMNTIQEINKRLQQGESVTEEVFQYRKDGSSFWSELVIQPIYGDKGEVLLINSFILDVTNRKINESLLEQQKHIFMGINQGKDLEELLQDVCHRMEPFFSSETTCAYMFIDPKEGWVMRKSSLLTESLALGIENGIMGNTDLIKDQRVYVGKVIPNDEHRFVASWSLPIHNQDGQKTGVFLIYLKESEAPTELQIQYLERLIPVIQMTNKYFDQQSRLLSLAYFDLATGLPNRYTFQRKLTQIVEKNNASFVAVIAANEYTKIIDLYGRDAGDELFKQLAKRLQKTAKDTYIGRLSSATLLYTKEKTGVDAKEFEYELRRMTIQPFMIAGEEVYISLKVGVSLADNQSSAEEMIRRGDIALTKTKRIPGGALSFYNDVHNEETIKEMTIINELIRALAVDGLDVYLQPKVDLTTGEIISFEALARWNSPILGQVPPNVFIPIAEDIGKIIDLEICMFRKVLKWQSERMHSGKKMYQVAINVSVDHFFHPSFVMAFGDLVEKTGVPAKYIRLEITESIGLVDFNQAKEIFENLNAKGFEISIDDFGVGYSSLSYLPQLQVSELKIDRSFINKLHEQGTYAVVMTIIQLANNLNIETVAEGIEEVHQIEALTALGCKIGQGFYYYKPKPLEEINLLLDSI